MNVFRHSPKNRHCNNRHKKFCRKYNFKEIHGSAILLKTVFNKSIPEAYLAGFENQHTDNIPHICFD